jgi:hypothetical protein
MIEVKARMVRSAVYLAGEMLQCEIIFTNIGENSSAKTIDNFKGQSKDATGCKVERLAWASVQIHCQCSVNSHRIIIPEKHDTSIGDVMSPVEKSSTSFAPS